MSEYRTKSLKRLFITPIKRVVNWFEDRVSHDQKMMIKKVVPSAIWYRLKGLGDTPQRRAEQKIASLRTKLLNLGFNERARLDLEAIVSNEENGYLQQLAAWELAVYLANQYKVEAARRCLELLRIVRRGEHDLDSERQMAILEAECYEITGSLEKAKQIITLELSKSAHHDLYLAAANLESSVEEKVHWINKAFMMYNLAPVKYKKSDKAFYDSLEVEVSKSNSTSDQPKVTVIIPVYNAADVIQTALNSVLMQTWENLEVIVVDDCSTDRTPSIIESVKDKRVTFIRAKTNGGPYVSRNIALQHATGEFITCHDADDWSHPEKIEKQVKHLLENKQLIGNTSEQARATNELQFYRRGKPGIYLFSNMSSFMFRRKPVVERLGYWDSVRFGADAEFIRRIKRLFGNDSIQTAPTGPVSFQRQSKSSLTGSSVFGYDGFFMGARKEYFHSYMHYYRQSKDLNYEFPQEVRPFPVPEPMKPDREVRSERKHFDVILVSDFRLVGGSNMSNIEEIKAQKALGIRTGLIQLYRYDYDVNRTINPRIRELLDDDLAQLIVYGEQVSCDLLILRYPPILQEKQIYVPDVKAKDIRVIVNQPPMSDYGPEAELRYELPRAKKHLKEYFGSEGIWHPIGPLVREALHEHHANDVAKINLSEEDWVNIINIGEWRRSSRPKNSKIRIGRHSRDLGVKWPESKEALLAAYPNDEKYEIHVLGGAKAPRDLLGKLPSNWRVTGFGELHPRDFLAGIDVYVYYTHSDWVESFGRVIIEAMAVGVPVILPHSYKDLFGEAAIYADVNEVKQKIDEIMSDSKAYEAQVEKAFCYVEEKFGYSRHEARLQNSNVLKIY